MRTEYPKPYCDRISTELYFFEYSMKSEYEATIKPFLKRIIARQAAETSLRRAMAKAHAIDFNPFRVIRLNEVRLSAILAFLLSPNASHGQGTLFLDEFLKLRGDEAATEAKEDAPVPPISTVDLVTSQAKVYTEYTVPNGRIDILVEIPRVVEQPGKSDFRMIIENKFGAEETGDQLTVYDEWASRGSNDPGKDYRLLYLTPRTETPNKLIPGLICLSYKDHILKWLSDAKGGIEAAHVWQYVSDLEDYFQRRLSGGMARMERKKLAEEIARDPEAVHAAIDVAEVQDDLKRHIAERLRDKLHEQMGSEDVEVTTDEDRPNFGDQYSGYRFLIGYNEHLQVFFRFKQKDFRGLACGLKWRGLKEELASTQGGFSEVRKQIAEQLGREPQENAETETFVRFGDLPMGVPSDWIDGQTWARVQNGEIQAAMSEFVRNRIIAVLRTAKLL